MTSAEASGERAVAAGRDIRHVATGDHTVLAEHATVLPAEAFTQTECPPGVVNLPSRTNMFVGRERELALLDEALGTCREVVVHAVHGLGGIGKSTLAAYWAARYAGAYNPVWWITAETPAEIDAGLAALAVALQPALAGILPQDALRERAVQWLAAHEGWLVVLDNVAKPEDVRPLLARVTSGRWLITSRRADDWYGIARPVALDVLLPDEAVDLFARIVTHSGPRDVGGADQLCAELGHLPLAVELAAAYCARTGTSATEYLELLAQYPADMYAEGRRAVARTWRVTLDRLVAEDPLTGQVLRVLAWYAPDAIPRSLLDGLGSTVAVRRAIGALAAHSMVKVGEGGELSVHRLVQAVARAVDEGDPHRQGEAVAGALRFAASSLSLTMGAPAGSLLDLWTDWGHLLPHLDNLAEHASWLGEETDQEYAEIHRRVQAFLGAELVATGALERLSNAIVRKRPTGPLEARDVALLIDYFEQALADRMTAHGDDDAGALGVCNTLAGLYRAVGVVDRAIPLYERTLVGRERVLGDDHPDTITARNNLVDAYQAVGDLERVSTLRKRCG